MPTALLVSPHAPTRDALIAALNGGGIAAVATAECDTALRCLGSVRADIVLLDTLCGDIANLRADVRALSGPIPVLYIAGRDAAYSPIELTENGNGTDSVVSRPVDPSEVVAAAKVALGLGVHLDGDPIRTGDAVLDPGTQTLTINGTEVGLTQTEFRIACCLAEGNGDPVPIAMLYRRVWGADPVAGTGDTVRAHVRNLRAKLRDATGRDDLLVTVPRRGYRLVPR